VTVFLQVWMITGDKQETAINIAIACKLVHHIKDLLIVNAHESEEAAKARLQELLALCRDSGAIAEGGCSIKVGLWLLTRYLLVLSVWGMRGQGMQQPQLDHRQPGMAPQCAAGAPARGCLRDDVTVASLRYACHRFACLSRPSSSTSPPPEGTMAECLSLHILCLPFSPLKSLASVLP
jgi:hypothetical protein